MTNLQRARELLRGLLMLAGGIAVVCQPEIGVMFIVLIVVWMSGCFFCRRMTCR